MGQVLHGSATTTEAVRRAIQHSQESLRALAKRYGVNPKTIAKWKGRTSVADLPTGPKEPRSTVLTVEEEAVVVAFRRHTLLPLDDCLYALQPTIPHLTRSSLHRSLPRDSRGVRPHGRLHTPGDGSHPTYLARDEDRTGIVDLVKRKPPKLAAVALATMLQARFCPDASWLIRRYSLIISRFRDSTLLPQMQKGIPGGFTGPPQENGFEVHNLQK
jgi:hypothetical protein